MNKKSLRKHSPTLLFDDPETREFELAAERRGVDDVSNVCEEEDRILDVNLLELDEELTGELDDELDTL